MAILAQSEALTRWDWIGHNLDDIWVRCGATP